MSALIAISDLAYTVYCPRQFYYAHRNDDRTPPSAARGVRALAFDYLDLLGTANDELASRPISVSPAAYRERLARLHEHDGWDAFTNPIARDELLAGKGCRDVTHKLIGTPDGEGDRPPVPVPSFVSPGEPPECDVWRPQCVRAIALAEALAWEREAPVPRALVEYPAVGVVRTVGLATGSKAARRRVLRATHDLDLAPSRLRDSAKYESCTYRGRYGVKA